MKSNKMKTISILFVCLINTLLTVAQQPEGNWDRVWEIKPGYYRVMQNGLTGVIDSEGEVLIPCQFDQVYDLTDDNYIKVLKNLKIGLYHLEKGIILPVEYDQVWAYEDEIAKVMKNKKIGYVNREGFLVIPVEYNHIWQEEDGLIKVMKDGKLGFLNKSGQIVLPVDYQQIWSFEDNMAKVLKNGKTGYIDRNGNEVIPTIYDRIFPFRDGIARAKIGNNTFYIDETGKIIDGPEEYQEENSFISETTETGNQNIIANSGSNTTTSTEVRNSTYGNEIIIRRDDYTSHTKSSKIKNKSFKGHLSSVGLGINSYVNQNFEEVLPTDYEFLDVNRERSCEVVIYPFQQSTRLLGSRLGLVSAIGLQFNNYRFNLYNSDDLNSNEIAKTWFQPIPDNVDLDKAKMTIFSLNVPVMLEIQLPDGKGKQGIYLAGGIIGSMKLNTHTKVKYRHNDEYFKPKLNKDIGMNLFRYSFMARAGYNWIGIYATYSPVSMFKKDKGPDLFPYSVGVSINF